MKQLCLILLLVPCWVFAQNTGGENVPAPQDSAVQTEDSVLALPPALRNSLQNIIEDVDSGYSGGPTEDPSLNLGVMVVNETRTRIGAEFYDMFYQSLNIPPGQETATVIVTEEPFRARMTRLNITVNDVDVVQTILRPNTGDYLEELVNNSVQRVSYYVQNFKEVQESLNGEDLSGSGIF